MTDRRKRFVHATIKLYRAARAFADDRRHFAPGQDVDFVPRVGTDHWLEHRALSDAAIVYACAALPVTPNAAIKRGLNRIEALARADIEQRMPRDLSAQERRDAYAALDWLVKLWSA